MPNESPFPIAVLISGGGTTMQNLIDRIALGKLDARIVRVISSRREVGGVEKAQRAGLLLDVLRLKDFPSPKGYGQAIFDLCRNAGAKLVVLGGFLQHLWIPPDFAGRVINIHPSLLPSFGGQGMYGRYVHEAVLSAGCKISGCTVHFVDAEYDRGPIILQRATVVKEDDIPETLAARVFLEECEALPEAIRLFAEDRLRIEGGRVRIL